MSMDDTTSSSTSTTISTNRSDPAIGTRIYKEFPSHGWYWGTITAKYTEQQHRRSSNDDYNGDDDDNDDDDDGAEREIVMCGYRKYYDIAYDDGDSETIDGTAIQAFVQCAMDNDHNNDHDEKGRNHINNNNNNNIKPSQYSSTSTTATSTSGDATTNASDDSNFNCDDDDDDDDMEDDDDDDDDSSGPTNKRPRRRTGVTATNQHRQSTTTSKRQRRSVSYHEKYDDDDNDDDDDKEEEVNDVTPIQRKSPLRKCRLQSPTKAAMTTSTTTNHRTVNVTTKSNDVKSLPSKISSDNAKVKGSIRAINNSSTTNGSSKSRNVKATTTTTTTATTTKGNTTVGRYDKQPYSGGKDLEVISDIQQMFDDMISSKLLSNDHLTQLLCRLLTTLQHRAPIKIATMCSGTESPILALDMIQNAIYDTALGAIAAAAPSATATTTTNGQQQNEHPAATNNKHFQQFLSSLQQSSSPDSSPGLEKLFPIQHVFSCEIEPYKQAYIERNFNPPILFRDIRELGNDQAYTAYGALVDVPNTPGSVDVLIAGTSCVDYSNLNNQKKNMEEKGESGATFYGMLRWIEKAQPPIVIIENVYGAPWNEKVKLFEERGYSATFMRLDTKDYYIPHTRQRGYLFAVRHRNGVNNNKNKSGKKKTQQRQQQEEEDLRPSEWTKMVTSLKRPASASVDDFMLPNDDPRVLRGRARLTAECAEGSGGSGTSDMSSSRAGRVDWTKCETRHLTSRSIEELGDKRPFTNWSDSGCTTLPSFSWNEWCNVQVHRIHDLMDINTLRLAKVGIDGTYKTMVWNLSQNVDRDTMGKLGLCQCLTPTGVPYVTNRGGPLVGEELLMLQGIPVDDLLLTKETEDNLKDLAGNAMSTTVVGACMLCALLVGQDAISSNDEFANDTQIIPSLVPRPLEPLSEICISQQFGEYEKHITGTGIDSNNKPKYLWDSFLFDASTSAKMCVSETEDEALPLKSIAQCGVCGHTSSAKNAYPARKYEEHEFGSVTTYSKRANPSIFRRTVLDMIPMRVCIKGIDANDLSQPEGIESELWQEWKDSVQSALISHHGELVEFRFAELVRTHEWTAIYRSQCQARLEIKISKRGVTWFLFVKPPTRQCSLRTMLERPSARLHVSPFIDGTFSMLAGKWEICIPLTKHFKLGITGVGEQVPSWRSRLGLKGIYENEVQYETLQILVDSIDPSIGAEFKDKIDGNYTLLPKCGGACGSLRRKDSGLDNGEDDDNLYFFLASNRSTLSSDDAFVISQTFHRTDYKEYRDIFLELDNSYSPMCVGNKSTNHQVNAKCSSYGCWLTVNDAVVCVKYNNSTVVRHPFRLSVPMNKTGWKECPELVSATFPVNINDDIVTKCLKLGGSAEVNLTKSLRILKHVAFATSKWKLPNIFNNGDWFPLSGKDCHGDFEMLRCENCAPVKPKIKWTLVSKGKRASYIPLEDVRQAAIYERAVKARPKPWLLRISVTNDDCFSPTTASMTIQIGCNVVSVVQRAFGLLPHGSMVQRSMTAIGCDATKRYTFEWRIVEHTDVGVGFPMLSFTSNKQDEVAAQPPQFKKFGLRKEQLRSLTWMLRQEKTTEPFYEEEVAEAVFPSLNWRIEGRVRRPVLARGGIIADEVGYGKTAITLGLIDAAESINGLPPMPPSGYCNGYIYTKATLVVVPKHLMGQWPDEVRKFLGKSKSVCVIKDLTALNKVTIDELKSADIVVVSFAVLSNETYFARLARLSGLNPESFSKGNGSSRHFAAVYAECVNALPTRVDMIVNNTADVYTAMTSAAKTYEKEKLSDRVLLDGKKSIYKNTAKSPSISNSKTARSSIDADPWGLSSLGVKKSYVKMSCPPLEAFFWQRLVVDEFTYLANKDREHVLEVVSNIHCSFRWFLSGTPKHANFNDISELASMLGVHLGIDEVLPGVKLTKKYLSDKDNSGLESLSHYLESRSMQWHGRRHKLSQSFLDRFVRQNVAEIDEIPYEENVCMVSLPAVERAIYMELETHLKSLEMNCMTAQRSKRKCTSDRESRMQRILEESESGEEALLKCCSHFNMSSSSTALETMDDIIRLRKSEKIRLEDEMIRSLAAAFRHQQNVLRQQPDWSLVTATGKGEIHDAFRGFVGDVQAMKSVPHGADNEINNTICSLVAKGRTMLESSHRDSSTYFEQFNDIDEYDETTLFEMKHELRNHMHFVRSLTKELCGRIRSLRYIENIRQFQLKYEAFQCTMCNSVISDSDHSIGVLSCCGHAGCINCLNSHANEGRCIFPDCCARVSKSHIASADRLGVDNDEGSSRFGRKLSSVVQKVTEIVSAGNDDRVIVFCQFDDLKALVADALKVSNILSLQVKGTVVQQVNTISIFQKDIPDKSDPRVLLLKMDDEQSAGLNLTNLNHAIFLHPLLAASQEAYNSFETQAIGRIRRYGQKKKVYCWRFLADDTIDTEIFEQRRPFVKLNKK